MATGRSCLSVLASTAVVYQTALVRGQPLRPRRIFMSREHPNRNRRNLIKVYLSDDEYRRFKDNVKACRRTNSSYVRELIVETTPIAFPPIEYQEVLRELRKIGINLNQLASKAHTLGFVDEREYRAESERLGRVVAELAKPMTKGGVKFGNHKDMGC